MASRDHKTVNRRKFMRDGLRIVGACGLVGGAGLVAVRKGDLGNMVWQIDPNVCIACGKCVTSCVLDESAVKCFHNFQMCGYCELCTGYFEPEPNDLNSGAENQLCPTGAISRQFVEEPYYEYKINHELCIGCGKCVEGCSTFGNGSLYLQVSQDICLNCNECAIAVQCPSRAFRRVSGEEPYIFKGVAIKEW